MAAQMPEGKRAAKAPRTQEEKDTTPHVVIILEQAAVEVVKTKKVRRPRPVLWHAKRA